MAAGSSVLRSRCTRRRSFAPLRMLRQAQHFGARLRRRANASVSAARFRSAHACKTPQCQRAISVARYTSTSPRSRLDCCGFDCGSLCRRSPVNVIRPGGPHSEAGAGRTFSAPVDAGPGAARSAAVGAALASRAGRDVRIEESWSRFGPNRWLVERVPPQSDSLSGAVR